MLEKDIENAILDYLNFMPNCFAWKNQNVGVFDSKKQLYRKLGKHQFRGISDIIGICHGMPLFIEVKTPKRKNNLSEHQEAFLYKVKEHGALAFVDCSIEDVKEE